MWGAHVSFVGLDSECPVAVSTIAHMKVPVVRSSHTRRWRALRMVTSLRPRQLRENHLHSPASRDRGERPDVGIATRQAIADHP